MRTQILIVAAATLLLARVAAAAERVVHVADDAALRAALREAGPGTRIQIAPGKYRPGIYVERLTGTAEEPIIIEGADEREPPQFLGGSAAWHLAGCAHVTLRNMIARGQSGNGINCDDIGSVAHHLVLEKIHVAETGPRGNCDAIKLSGVEDFVVRQCTFEGWSGQAPDMVRCRRGLVEECTFRPHEGVESGIGPQMKGGSFEITVRRCLFLDAVQRGVNLGGSTSESVFAPQQPDERYEARDLLVEGCTFVGGDTAVAYLSCGAVFRYNTVYRPKRWILRILKENNGAAFPDTADGRFERNLIVFTSAIRAYPINIGPNTRPETFRFAENWWYCEDRPEASRPALPSAESGGVYGVDPQLAAPERQDFRPLNARAAAYGATAWKAGG